MACEALMMESSRDSETIDRDMQVWDDGSSVEDGDQMRGSVDSSYSFYYWDAFRWQEVPTAMNIFLSEAYKTRKDKIVVSAGKSQLYEIDFGNKLQKNRKTGYLQSLAWECHSTGLRVGFDTPINGEKQEPVPGQDFFGGISSRMASAKNLDMQDPPAVPIKAVSGGQLLPPGGSPFQSKAGAFFSKLNENVAILDPEDTEFNAVKLMFGKGSQRQTQPRITAIHKVMNSDVRKRAFADQACEMERCRGNARLKYAWYGASADEISSIVTYGFSSKSTSNSYCGRVYGNGTYLAPASKPESYAKLADKDSNKEQHIILCEVILGESEVIPAGSQACLPSSTNFDSGTDSLTHPSLYVIWSPFINSHMIAWYIVSFVAEEVQQKPCRPLRRLNCNRTSPYPPLRVPTRDAKVVEKLFHPSDPRTPSKLQWLNVLASPTTPTGVLPPLASPSFGLQRDLNVLSLLSPSPTASMGANRICLTTTSPSKVIEEGIDRGARVDDSQSVGSDLTSSCSCDSTSTSRSSCRER